jgi:uncharacterized damage-inducible protein DinB
VVVSGASDHTLTQIRRVSVGYDAAMTGTTFDLAEGRALLARTPAMLDAWLRDLPATWVTCDEGPGTWSAQVVLGHLIEGERSDWIPRARHLLEHGEAIPFPPFDRFSQLQRPEQSLAAELDEFAALRRGSLAALDGLRLTRAQLALRGRHPEFGSGTLAQHLATWVAHDLTHITQVARVMARRYADAVGPWRDYLRVVRDGL